MWGNIANLKENLNKIALDVHDEDEDEEDFKIHGSGNEDHSSVSDRRNSYRYAHSQSPVSNGIDSPCNPEVLSGFFFNLVCVIFVRTFGICI